MASPPNPSSRTLPSEPRTGWEGFPRCPSSLVPLGVGTARPGPRFLGPLPVLTHRGPTAVTQQRLFLSLSPREFQPRPLQSPLGSPEGPRRWPCRDVNQRPFSVLSSQSRIPRDCDHGWRCWVMGPCVSGCVCSLHTQRNLQKEAGPRLCRPPSPAARWSLGRDTSGQCEALGGKLIPSTTNQLL